MKEIRCSGTTTASVGMPNKNKSPQTWGSNSLGEGLWGNESYLEV